MNKVKILSTIGGSSWLRRDCYSIIECSIAEGFWRKLREGLIRYTVFVDLELR